MKSLKKMLTGAVAAVSLMLGTAFSANAVVISQDLFLFGGGFQLGTIEVEIKQSSVGTGFLDTAFDDEPSLFSVTFFGVVQDFDVNYFLAGINTDDLYAGLEYIELDLQEIGFDEWNYQISYDAFDPSFNFWDIFDVNGDLVNFGFEPTLGAARVSAPASIALISLAIAGIYLRRQRG